MFSTYEGGFASKAAAVATIESLGTWSGQPLYDPSGLRLFGGHSFRVTGAQLLAALGLEVNKVRILACHSGDTVLRHVAEAPLRSLREDLGLQPAAPTPATLLMGASTQGNAALRKRIARLELNCAALEDELQRHAQDMVSLATGFARADTRVYVQNSVTATVHAARDTDHGYTFCGWRYAIALRRNGGGGRLLHSLVGLPGSLLCERCLATERAIALSVQAAELSGDEN